MNQKTQKELLLDAAIKLLETSDHPESITTRQIAGLAGANQAMINYYFGSKDALIQQGVSSILNISANLLNSPSVPDSSPRDRLRRFLMQICFLVMKYRKYTSLYIPNLLLTDEILLPQYILPDLRAHFGNKRSEAECRIIAYELISFLQLLFYRSDSFRKYSGCDLSDELTAEKILDMQLDLFLADPGKD